MNLSQLYYFRKLAETQHYGKTSKELYITQPSLSNSIGNLEKELGVPLFERVGRNVRLTSFGAEFNKHICTALCEIDKAVELMHSYSSGLSGQVRIGTVISIQSEYLPELLHRFRQEFGDSIDFDVHQETTYGCIKGIEEDRFDFAFCGKLTDKQGLVFEPMLGQNLIAAVDKSQPLAQKASVTFDELKQYTLVSYRKESFASVIMKDLIARHNLDMMQGFNDEISGGSLVVAEKSIVAIMLETLQKDAIKDLVCIPIEGVARPFHIINLVYKKNAFHSYAVERMIEFSVSISDFRTGKSLVSSAPQDDSDVVLKASEETTE